MKNKLTIIVVFVVAMILTGVAAWQILDESYRHQLNDSHTYLDSIHARAERAAKAKWDTSIWTYDTMAVTTGDLFVDTSSKIDHLIIGMNGSIDTVTHESIPAWATGGGSGTVRDPKWETYGNTLIHHLDKAGFDTAFFIRSQPHYCTLHQLKKEKKDPPVGMIVRVGEYDAVYVYMDKWVKIR